MKIGSKQTVLRLGDSGAQVKQLEVKLKAAGALTGPADDRFDQRTAQAVVAFKQAHGWRAPQPVAGARLRAALEPQGATPARGPSTLEGGTYNCRIGRDPAVVARVVSHFARSRKLDFLQLQEISGYHDVLRKLPGYRLVTFPGSKDHGETGVLVKKGLEAKFPKSIEAATGWTNVHGGVAQPRAATSVRLAGWLRVASIHAPPGIDWKNGHAVGAAARVASYQSLTERLAAAANRQRARNPDVALLYGGDWNEGARTAGPGSPSSLASRTGMTKYGTGGIDWEMARGCQVKNVKVGPRGGSDHRLVTFTVRRAR